LVEFTATFNKCLTLKNDLELFELAQAEFEMVVDEFEIAKKQLKIMNNDVCGTTGILFLMTQK
jgi:hypothetical protein